MLNADGLRPRLFHRPQKLIEFGLDRRTVAVLTILDQENCEEGKDRGRGVDDQLPGIGVIENRTGERPDNAS